VQNLRINRFYSNAPLLFLYPWLVSLGLTLGQVNALLHAWLCISWCLQLFGMKGFSGAFTDVNLITFCKSNDEAFKKVKKK
jgi:hypothetical protein